uniref:Acid phosphatase n=1 Tax=Noctiluca scintillans TaxID=2966 RepID=A0A7S1F0D2_NOCSC|mmetsp:Transcript_21766/g.57701  ORF Transcript_21766/g.57701 Transcript_21766/m.57701 type:complete len:397 (+) Transcript_21766:70-1260(+)
MACRIGPRCCLSIVFACFCVELTGCGNGQKSARTTVLLMRHCVRSVPDSGVYAVAGFKYYNNYSATAWPAFDIPSEYCSSRGEQLAKGSGQWFKGHSPLTEPVRVIADNLERNNISGRAFLTGYGQDVTENNFLVDGSSFDPASTCDFYSHSEIAAFRQEQYEANPRPEPWTSQMMRKLYDVLGEGVAGNWTAVSCKTNNESGFIDGSCSGASGFVERMLMNWGSGLPVAWDRFQSWELPQLLNLNTWYRYVVFTVPKVVAKSDSSILRNVHETFQAGQAGTTVFVGHARQLNAFNALGVSWDAAPYPVNASLPSSVLRLELEGGFVTGSYLFVTNFTDETGDMTAVPVRFGTEERVPIARFADLLTSGSDVSCANPLPKVAATRRESNMLRWSVV